MLTARRDKNKQQNVRQYDTRDFVELFKYVVQSEIALFASHKRCAVVGPDSSTAMNRAAILKRKYPRRMDYELDSYPRNLSVSCSLYSFGSCDRGVKINFKK